MKRVVVLAGLVAGFALGASLAHAQEIETFDSPNELQTSGGNFQFTNDTNSFTTGNGAVDTFGSTYFEISTNPNPTKNAPNNSYGSGYHSIYADDNPPAGSSVTTGYADISSSSYLQLDITVNKGTDTGILIDLLDNANDFYEYTFGYDLTGNAATDNANAANDQLQPGEVVTQGALPNEEILDVPLADYDDINGTGTFNYDAITLFRITENPNIGTAATTNLPSDVSYYDLSGVNLPEPASLSLGALGCLLVARRRRV